MIEDIMIMIKKLNKADVLPHTSLRMNSVYYAYVSYINNTIALLFSEEYDSVALFVRRVNTELTKLKLRNCSCEGIYFEYCNQYIKALTSYLINNDLVSDFGKECLFHEYGK